MLGWYRRARRDLPWRRTRDPYRIWVSEIMLQQTRVDVVVPYYDRFLERFPDVESLAQAPLSEVLRSWAGLGYYGRARNLSAAARHLLAEHAGRLPRTAGALEALPGIGRYTAGAIRSIAFGQPAPILDGNVTRVFARIFGLDAEVDSRYARERLWGWATLWAAGRDPGAANQALMELGATICTKPVPECNRCPLAGDCVAHRTGREQLLPRPRARPAAERVNLEAILARNRGQLLLVRRSSGRLLRDWWELPACRVDIRSDHGAQPTLTGLLAGAADASSRPIAARLRERLGVEVPALRPLAAVRHGILNHRLEVSVFSADARRARSVKRASPATDRAAARTPTKSLASLDHGTVDAHWFGPQECRGLPLSTLARKALRAASRHDPYWSRFLAHGSV